MLKGRKKKYNKYEKPIDGELDLHGLRLEEAQAVFVDFIAGALEHNDQRVRIITGKGLHSVGGVSVIREMVIDILKAGKISFRAGKPDEGGDGVIIADF